MGLDTVVMEEGGLTINPEDLRARLSARMTDLRLSQAKAAGLIGVQPTRLNQWINGKYEGDNEKVERAVFAWLEGQTRQAELAAAGIEIPDFVETPTARRLAGVFEIAQFTPDMGVIAGAPGVSKTKAARAYAAKGNNVWLVTMDPEISSPARMLGEIVHTLGLPGLSPAKVRYEIEDFLAHRRALLIIDEAQHLKKAALDMARSLHDRIDLGIVLMGNHGFFGDTIASSRTNDFAQFFSRIGSRLKIDSPTHEDVEAMLDAWKIEGQAERKECRKIAGKMGALRLMHKTLVFARQLAAGGDEEMTLKHIQQAFVSLNHQL